MKRFFPYVVSFVALVSFAHSYAQDSKVNGRQVSPMERFLGMNCPDEVLGPRIVQALKANAREAETYFVDLIERGPDAELVAAERAHAKQHYGRRQAFMKNHSRRILREGFHKDMDSAQESEKDYVKRRLRSLQWRLTYRSLEGLRIVESPSSKAYLLRKAQDKRFPMREVAAEFAMDSP